MSDRSISLRSTHNRIRERGTTILPNRRRNCASGKGVSPAIGNTCAGRFVSRRQTPGLLSSGRKNLRLCENGSATPPPASRQRCNVIISIFDSTTESSLTDDQIALAEELLQHPVAAQRIREESFRVILDEAQDTEPLQFSVLLEATRPPEAKGLWLQDRHLGPRPGHFCMVGDFQQSIYWKRADLNYYRAVHEALIADKNGESLEFAVTFRLDQKQLDFVNETFREILNNKDGQVRFRRIATAPGNSSRESHSRAACRERIVAGRKKTEGLPKGTHRSGISCTMDQGRRTEKTFGRFVAGGGDPLSAQGLAANDGRSFTSRRFAGGDPI